MPWQIAIAISVFMGVVNNLVVRTYSQTSRVPASFPPAISYLFGVMPVGLTAGILLFPHHVTWSWWLVSLLIIEGVAMTACNWFGFIVSGKMAVAPRMTITQSSTVMVVLLGWTLLSEKLTFAQCIGAALLVSAAILAIWAPSQNVTAKNRSLHFQHVALALATAAALAVGLVTEKALLGHMDIGAIFIVGWSAQTIGMLLLASTDLTSKKARNFTRSELRSSVIMGVTGGLTGVFYVYSIFHSDNVSLITVIAAAGLPTTVLGAYVVLGEKENQKLVWFSLALACLGLITLTFH